MRPQLRPCASPRRSRKAPADLPSGHTSAYIFFAQSPQAHGRTQRRGHDEVGPSAERLRSSPVPNVVVDVVDVHGGVVVAIPAGPRASAARRSCGPRSHRRSSCDARWSRRASAARGRSRQGTSRSSCDPRWSRRASAAPDRGPVVRLRPVVAILAGPGGPAQPSTAATLRPRGPGSCDPRWSRRASAA